MSSIDSSSSAPILANIQKLGLRASQIGGRGSMRHKLPKPQKASNQLQIYEDIIKKFNPAKTPVSNIGGINFFSSENSKQNLQFNFPLVNAIGKAHAMVITGKAVQPSKDDDDIPDMADIPDLVSAEELNEIKDTPKEDKKEIKDTPKKEIKAVKDKKEERKQNKHEKLLRSLLSKKLKVQELSDVDEVKIQIKKEFFSVEDPYVMKVLVPTKDIYVVFGVIKPWAEESGTITTDTQSLLADFSQDIQAQDDQAPDLVPGERTETIKSDIDIVMSQTNATRDQAMHALSQHNGDIVEAIMALSQ